MKLSLAIVAAVLLAASTALVYYSPTAIVNRARKRGYNIPSLNRGAVIRKKDYA
jgi:hypothetical protein